MSLSLENSIIMEDIERTSYRPGDCDVREFPQVVYDQCLECGLPFTKPSDQCRRHRDVWFARDRGAVVLSDDPKLLEPTPKDPVREGDAALEECRCE